LPIVSRKIQEKAAFVDFSSMAWFLEIFLKEFFI